MSDCAAISTPADLDPMRIRNARHSLDEGWGESKLGIPGWIVLSHPDIGVCLHPDFTSRVKSVLTGALIAGFAIGGVWFFIAAVVKPSWFALELPHWWLILMGSWLLPILMTLVIRGFRAMFGTTFLMANQQAITVRRTLIWHQEERQYPGQAALRIVHRKVGNGGRLIELLIAGANDVSPTAPQTLSEMVLDHLFDRLPRNQFALQVSELQSKALANALSRATGRKVTGS